MIDRRARRVGFLRRILVALAPVAAACGVLPAEAQLLMDFFQAARLGDGTMLAKVSLVGFDPRTGGAVQYFEIVAMGEEQRRTLRIGGASAARNPDGGSASRNPPYGAGRSDEALAVSSLTPRGQPEIDVTGMDVEIVAKPVTVIAQVNTPDGRTVPRTLVFTFERAVGRRGSETGEGRWMITGMRLDDPRTDEPRP